VSDKQTVLVTGASGYIASWLVRFLLESNQIVHATVRSLSNQDKIKHLLDLQKKYPGQLHLFEADLLKAGSFKMAMKACTVVMHTASPFKIDVNDAQKELVQPALEGTRNVLEEISNCPSVTRVVLTSSVAAINGDNYDLKTKAISQLDESHWNTTSSLKHQPYSYSKTVAEKEAWRLQKEQNRWDLVVINPSFVMGPSLTNRVDGQSTQFMLDLLKGKLAIGAPDLHFGYVDVRDVAKAHIQAMLVKEASGRHILCQNTYSIVQVAAIIQQLYPKRFNLPARQLPKWMLYLVGPFIKMSWKSVSRNIGHPLDYNNSKSIKHLQIKYKTIETTMKDHVQQLFDSNLISA
jgi:nucleoside-diphosphate-sugar epimerase